VRSKIGRVHLSRLLVHDTDEPLISDCFPDEKLFRVQEEPWFADIVNYLVIGEMPGGGTRMIVIVFYS